VLFGNRDSNTSAPAAASVQTPEQRVTEHYAPIIELAQPLEKGGKTIVFDDFLKQVDELYRYLTAVQDAANSGMPAPAVKRSAACRPAQGVCPAGCSPCSAIWRWAPAAIRKAASWKMSASVSTSKWAVLPPGHRRSLPAGAQRQQ
jgi:hypothetical protein